MKLTASLAILALAASQAMAVVPTPFPGCTKSIKVAPVHENCFKMAGMYGTNMTELLRMNIKLREDCKNLDEGYPICVSDKPGDCCLNEDPFSATIPVAGPTPTASGAPVPPPASSVPVPAPTTPAAASPVASAPATPSDGKTPSPTVNKPSEASGSKSSMILAAVGVVLSVAYMF
ncbi:hypothetical protein BGX34_000301 [Mortierella sp. NVP85]|nr:hypothetical protein BGX34_000301 [Mortierella sp. NVP85]